MKATNTVRALLAETETKIKQLTGYDASLKLVLTVDDTMQHELVIAGCQIWNIELKAIKKRDRHKDIVTMRQLLAWLLKQKTLLSLRQIAAQLGYAGHDDVIHAISRIKEYLACNDAIAIQYYEPIKHLFDE